MHWGRKVLEVRPPVTLEKGHGIAALFGARCWRAEAAEADESKQEGDQRNSGEAGGGGEG